MRGGRERERHGGRSLVGIRAEPGTVIKVIYLQPLWYLLALQEEMGKERLL